MNVLKSAKVCKSIQAKGRINTFSACFYCLFALAPLLFSCEQTAEKPTLSKEKMAQIMADLYLAESATNGLIGYSKDSLAKVYYQQVLEIHGITQELYDKELQLRAGSIDELEALHKEAQNILGVKEGGVE